MPQILMDEQARQVLRRSLDRSVRAAAATCAPLHGTLLYDRGGQARVAQDGFEAVRESAEDTGALSIGGRILKETLAEAQRDLGDGTARLALFIGAAMEAGLRQIAAGASPTAFADALLAQRPGFDTALLRQSSPAPAPHAFALAQGLDEALAAIFAEAIAHAGPDGAIDMRAGHRDESGLEVGQGFLVNLEPVSQALPPATGARLELAQPYILVANDRLSALGRLAPLLDQFATRGKSLAIITRGAEGPALDTLVVNGRLPGATLTALQPPAAGLGAVAVLEDLAVATGAMLIDPALGVSLDHVRPAMLGRAERLVLSRGVACFEGPAGDASRIAQRQRDIHAAFERQRYLSLDREQLARREARLSGRWARITQAPVPGEGREETEARVAALRKLLAQMRAAETGGVLRAPRDGILTLAGSLAAVDAGGTNEDRAARTTFSAGLLALAAGCGTAPWEAMPVLSGIVRKGVSATATMLRIAAIISD
ncbi:hypothetical protein ACELLULO517_13705 [Acidisoma cellulosilytica]|uniref:60 kDa chaperonin n=1 Tax=Acidisoma cellulosilyticum TaxID=2802395 RepID=A0A964E4U2_9PROT|nr:hypothetical protein [Acidisoma cellulosilyticum]MCB8881298.1 hypothetical protein [Acidisoma cellulosilyticum]